MKLNTLQVSVLNNFLNLLVIEVANNYLNKLKNFTAKEVDEFVLKFLDNSVFLANEKIDITNSRQNSHIVKMNSKEQKKFEKTLSKKNSYSNMCKMLNFIYVLIKEEEQQEVGFKRLYNWYEVKETKILNNEDLNIYKEIKPGLLNNNKNIYSGNIGKI